MGRTDAIAFTNEWATRARQLGALVTVEPGWDVRGNGMAANYEGGLVHHTAVASSESRPFPGRTLLIQGRSDLPGPLCNVAGPWCRPDAPRLHVISARPANHAGRSGGRSMGPLPVTASFNACVFGLEIDYSGVAPMAPGQYRAALIFARAVADVLGRSTEYVRAHAETSVTGKWDPGYAMNRTIDMAAFRRDAANLSTAAQEDDDMTPDQDRLLRELHGVLFSGTSATPRNLSVYGRLVDVQTALTNALPVLLSDAQRADTDPQVIAAAVVAAIPQDIAQDVIDGLGRRLAAEPSA